MRQEYPQPLALVKFEDTDGKARGYSQALENEYRGASFGTSVGLGLTGAILGFAIVGYTFCLMGFIWQPIIGSAAVGGASIFFLEWWRRRGVKKFLQDSEARYLHHLGRAVSHYNNQVKGYNERLLAALKDEDPARFEELNREYALLSPVCEDLKKKVEPYVGVLSALDMEDVSQSMKSLREAEAQLALPPSSSKPLALPSAASAEYNEALAELDSEYSADKD